MAEQIVTITTKPPAAGPYAPGGYDKAVEDDDPYQLTGVRYPVAPGVDADREVALAIVEEFALSGWAPDRIRGLFGHPGSGAAHQIYIRRGAELIEEVVGCVFGSARPTRPAAEEG